ncbi:MAG TPA: serine/threonine-protein kinase, partial [Acidimicrobiales bacterium]|nr:serine/threonine-protein kinase [Acidimicrobiales bacterium]
MVDAHTLHDEVLAGRYRLGPLLGRGGMADVRQGLDLRLGRPVAVKLLRPEMSAQPEVRRRFEEEARSAARLSHPNAVSVYDTGEDSGRPFIVMERLPGETLADRIGRGPVAEAWLLGIAHDVLGALAAAHAAGLVHRDVKPANILIGADGRAKVADFGIAKSVEATGSGAGDHGDHTATNVLVGTPAYLAPERLEGAPATTRSDIWALGAVLFESLAGTKPFPGTSAMAMAAAIQAGTPLALRQLRPDVSPRVADAAERALARRPEDRFATAEEMAEALGVGPLAAGQWRPPGGAGPVTGSGAEATLVQAERADRPDRSGPVAAGEPAAAGMAGEIADTRIAPDDVVMPAYVAGGAPGRNRRRTIAAVTACAVLAALVASGLALTARHGTAGPAHSAPPPPLSVQMRALSSRLRQAGPAAGAQGEATAGLLDSVAGAVDAGAGAPQAQSLVSGVDSWQASGELAAPFVGEVLGLLAQVPGVML